MPVGSAIHRYGISSLAPGATHEESFTIRTERRGVISVGPAMTRRGDPIGIFSRDVVWTPVREVLVRPHLVPMESLGAGLLRDLEGVSTDAVSQSDLAFHALREYVPGDDLRHIHWRSSAKVMASTGESALLVRQYLDTRRSHATIVVDDRLASWSDPEDFETAMAVAASIAVRAVLDEFDVSFVCGSHASAGASGSDGYLALDAVCRADFGDRGIVESGRQASTLARDTSLAFFVGGTDTGFPTSCARPPRSRPRSAASGSSSTRPAPAGSRRPAACPSCTSPPRKTSAACCAGACDERARTATSSSHRHPHPGPARTPCCPTGTRGSTSPSPWCSPPSR